MVSERLIWQVYLEAERGRLDPDIIPVLSLLVRIGVETTSSCSGRIAVKASNTLWEKRGTLVARWHFMPPLKNIVDAIRRASRGSKLVWLSAEPPIITGYADHDIAETVVKMAVASGFKYSCMRRSGDRYYIIIRGEERLDILVAIDGEVVADQVLAEIYRILGFVLGRGKYRLFMLKLRLEELLSRLFNA